MKSTEVNYKIILNKTLTTNDELKISVNLKSRKVSKFFKLQIFTPSLPEKRKFA